MGCIITTGTSVTTIIAYKPLTTSSVYAKENNGAYPYIDFQAPIYVVSQTQSSNGLGGTYATHYTYAGAKAHLTGGGFLGFRQVAAWDAQTGLVTTTTYGQDYPNQGLPLSVEKRTSAGQLLNQVQNTWQNTPLGGGAYHRSDLVQTDEQSWDVNGAVMPRTQTNTAYDAYGNATQITVANDDGYTPTGPVSPYGNVKTTTNTYTNDTANWLLGRLTRASVTSTLPTGVSATRTSAFAYQAGSGLLVQEVVEPDNAALKLVTDYTLDAFGNRVGVTVSGAGIAARTSTTTYDTQGRFPVSARNALGHVETRTFDPAFGNPLSLTGPNGLTTTWAYDGFGRKLRETRADGAQSNFAFSLCGAGCPSGAVYFTTATASGAPATTRYFDSLNREIRSETVSLDGRLATVDIQYDAWGRTYAVSRPYFPGGAIPWTTYEYDLLARPVRVTEPDGGVSLVSYDGLTTVATNALGQKNTTVKNGLGQTIQTVNTLGATQRFQFDPFGNPTQTLDPRGNAVTLGYDLRGRKTRMSDPDMGAWTYAYDVLGQLVQQKNAKGHITKLSYDLLGRMTKRVESGLTSTWTWDTAAKGIGKLAKEVTSNGWSRAYLYDAYGRPSQTKTTVGAAAYALTTQYDTAGRVARFRYPTGFTVENVYGANGYLAEVRDAATGKAYWQLGQMDAAGRVLQEALGNGLMTRRTYDAVGRVTAIKTGAFTTATVQDLNLLYDPVGNLTNRDDYVLNRSDMFTYDEVNRLTLDLGPNGTLLNFQYDELGNITFKTGVGSYTYGTKPHAISKISGAVNASFAYDANGNQTKGLNRTLTWTAWDMPAKIVQGAVTLAYDYDANHARFRQTGPAGTTIYLNPRPDTGAHFEETTSQMGVQESRHHIYAGKEVIGEVVINGVGDKSTRYFHVDQLGSVDAVTGDTGNLLARWSFDPFGNRTLYTGDANATRHGFTGHEMLPEVGLIHMNGRVYDPLIARFVSADPFIQFPDNLQSYNRYSYASNNPMLYTDPSGYGWFSKFFKSTIGKIVTAVAVVVASVLTYGAVTAALTSYTAAAGGATLFGTTAVTAAGATTLTASTLGGITVGAASGLVGGFTGGFLGSGGDWNAALQGAGFGAVMGGIGGGFSTWNTTNWSVTNPAELTKEMLKNRVIKWDQMLLKIASQSAVRGLAYTAFGQKFGNGFFYGMIPIAANELYRAYVPWDSRLVGNGGPGGPKDDFNGIIARMDGNDFGRNIVKGGFGAEGGWFSRVMDRHVPGMSAVSKVHDVWAYSSRKRSPPYRSFSMTSAQ